MWGPILHLIKKWKATNLGINNLDFSSFSVDIKKSTPYSLFLMIKSPKDIIEYKNKCPFFPGSK
jgi:hypothetical protein